MFYCKYKEPNNLLFYFFNIFKGKNIRTLIYSHCHLFQNLSSLRASPAICTSLLLMFFTKLMNSTSLEPRSRSIACFTVGDVPSGPGVNNFLSGFLHVISYRKLLHNTYEKQIKEWCYYVFITMTQPTAFKIEN